LNFVVIYLLPICPYYLFVLGCPLPDLLIIYSLDQIAVAAVAVAAVAAVAVAVAAVVVVYCLLFIVC